MASSKGKGSAALQARIKKMMQSDEDVGKVAKASPVVIGENLQHKHTRVWARPSHHRPFACPPVVCSQGTGHLPSKHCGRRNSNCGEQGRPHADRVAHVRTSSSMIHVLRLLLLLSNSVCDVTLLAARRT
jgi:hypothetical protein